MNKKIKSTGQIIYECDKEGWSRTNCPHTNTILRVGSLVCQKCKYHFMQDFKNHIVDCLCPINETLTKFPYNM